MVVSCLALVVATSGLAWAAVKIDTRQLKNRAVTAKKIDRQAVRAGKIADGAVRTGKLAWSVRSTAWATRSWLIASPRTNTSSYVVLDAGDFP